MAIWPRRQEKPAQLSWEASAAYMLVGATAYRQLMGWPPHIVNEGDPVLIWGGTGGLGSMAIQIAKDAEVLGAHTGLRTQPSRGSPSASMPALTKPKRGSSITYHSRPAATAGTNAGK